MTESLVVIKEIADGIKLNATPEFRTRGCVPILGAGISHAIYKDLNSAALTASLLANFEVPTWVEKELSTVAEYIIATADRKYQMRPKAHVASTIRNITSGHADTSNPQLSPKAKDPDGWAALKFLVSLPFQVIVTTNYDNLIEEAAEEVGKTVIKVVCNCFDESHGQIADAFPDNLDNIVRENKLIVYHLHGVLNNPASLVLSRDDYVDFLVSFSKDKDNSMLPQYIHTALTNHPLLLLGYSMDDINFRVLVKAIRATAKISDKSIYPGLSIQVPPRQLNLCRLVSENCDSHCISTPPKDIADVLPCVTAKLEEVLKEDFILHKESMETYLEKVFDLYTVSVIWETFQEFVEQMKPQFP
jgi:hypothetical protein